MPFPRQGRASVEWARMDSHNDLAKTPFSPVNTGENVTSPPVANSSGVAKRVATSKADAMRVLSTLDWSKIKAPVAARILAIVRAAGR